MSYSGYSYEVEVTDTHLIVEGATWGSVGNKLLIHHQTGNRIVTKLPTGRVYRGLGQQPGITPASFMVWELCEERDHANRIIQFPVRSER